MTQNVYHWLEDSLIAHFFRRLGLGLSMVAVLAVGL